MSIIPTIPKRRLKRIAAWTGIFAVMLIAWQMVCDPVIPAHGAERSAVVQQAVANPFEGLASPRAPNCNTNYIPLHKYDADNAPLIYKEAGEFIICTSDDGNAKWSRMVFKTMVWLTTNGKNANCGGVTGWNKFTTNTLYTETTSFDHDHFFFQSTIACDGSKQAKSKNIDVPSDININLYWGQDLQHIPEWHAYGTLDLAFDPIDEDFDFGGELKHFN